MKKYISIAIGATLSVGFVSIALAGPTCRNGMCTDGGGGERPELLCYRGSQQITWSGPTPLWGFCAVGGGGNNGFFMSRDACNFAYCSGLKSSASSFSGALAARGGSSAVNPSPALGSRAAALRDAVAARSVNRPAPSPSPSAPRAASAPVTRPSNAPSIVSRPENTPYANSAPQESVYRAPIPSYYFAQWARPAPDACTSATTFYACREAGAEVAGNSTNAPRDTCQWSEVSGVGVCRRVQL